MRYMNSMEAFAIKSAGIVPEKHPSSLASTHSLLQVTVHTRQSVDIEAEALEPLEVGRHVAEDRPRDPIVRALSHKVTTQQRLPG